MSLTAYDEPNGLYGYKLHRVKLYVTSFWTDCDSVLLYPVVGRPDLSKTLHISAQKTCHMKPSVRKSCAISGPSPSGGGLAPTSDSWSLSSAPRAILVIGERRKG